ncbi:uncharacterized protein PSFLO_00191 [Pseudozyma flocculosa]|uniref:Uncharacterized protein n=1 Tax=Pseudozyma flocculosa TaxID=84751 RepID=A0A5C3ES86_9BASI|nr:uncharacterized protein PSFLO_00191 [Pseudozyma flocculosa]
MADQELDYEAVRQENIRKNAELMLSLGLDKRRPPAPRKLGDGDYPGGSSSSRRILPPRKSSRIAAAAPRSYVETFRGYADGDPRLVKKEKREKVYRKGSRKSKRSEGDAGTGRYRDWGSDDDDYDSDDYVQPRSRPEDDFDSGDERRARIYSPSYRGKRDGSETFVEIPARSQLKRLRNPPLPTPPPSIDEEDGISPVRAPLPAREEVEPGKGRGALLFEEGYSHFRPNVTPEEMLRGGVFGGTAFRPYHSSVLRRDLDVDAELAELPTSWLEGLDVDGLLTSSTYDASKNRFGVKAGQSLEDWEQAGWVRAQDPRGWFQWYYRFYLGRRSSDDSRQISRWLKACGPAGRFKKMLVQKVAAAGGAWDDGEVNPVVRQTLWQWGYDLSQADYRAYL